MDESINGAVVLAQALKDQGVEYMFGIVGVPVIELGMIAQSCGLKYIGMRNEQAACYAASAIGYLTKRPAVCLTVPGPGLLHTLGGIQNANENGWPVIVISGTMDLHQECMGAFQELNQVAAAKPYCKFAARPDSISRIPFYVEKAVRTSMYGRPGACYIDMPADFIRGKASAKSIWQTTLCPEPPRILACPQAVSQAAALLAQAKSPLIVVGKGAAYARAEKSVAQLLTLTNIPFLPTPMGKGLVPDDHKLCVAPARSRALQHADVILLLGARLNWMLHFGLPPRFKKDIKIIQVDICPEEIHNNIRSAVALQGDVDSVVQQLNTELNKNHSSLASTRDDSWFKSLQEKIEANRKATEAAISEASPPMNYYNSLHEIQSLLPRDTFLVSEGSNTMDIGRTMLHSFLPRHRLDAGTYGTMGVGAGFAVAAALYCRDYHPGKRVVCVQGDSAFGFSGMEVETACRLNLPIIFIIINNNGIGIGVDQDTFDNVKAEGLDPTLNLSPNGLTPIARYEKIVEAFGGKGYQVNTREELKQALKECLANNKQLTLINTAISPFAGKKAQFVQSIMLTSLHQLFDESIVKSKNLK